MSDIDTAAIRAACDTMHASQLYDEVQVLCDALDAAWAVIADQTRDVAIRLSVRDERERDLKARAEAAEARIAAALALDLDLPIRQWHELRHALIGETS